MNRAEITSKLTEVFCDVFDEEIAITEETTAADVEDGDSLAHITLIATIEDTFGIKFSMKNVVAMKNVGEIIDVIERDIRN